MDQGFRIGEWLVRQDTGSVVFRGQRTRLEPKVMEVLVYLIQHRGEVLPKERLIQGVWPDTFVTDEVLTNAISELRKAFGDDPRNPRFIQTLPRRGYRLIAPVFPADETLGVDLSVLRPGQSGDSTNRSFWRNPVLPLIIGGLLMILAGLMFWPEARTVPEGPIDSIAVLPFRNSAAGSGADYLCAEIPGSISARLASIQKLRVIPTSNLLRLSEGEIEPKTIARQLGVRAVLQGWLNQIDGEISIRVELSDGLEDRVLWGQNYRRPLTDIFEIEEAVTDRIVEALRIRLSSEAELRAGRRPTESIEAYGAYLKAGFLNDQALLSGRVLENLAGSIEEYQRAIEIDPGFALPYLGLYRIYIKKGFWTTSFEDYSKARKAAERALDLDPSHPEVHLATGAVRAFYDHEWEAAGEEYDRARELGGLMSPDFIHPLWLLWMGRFEEAREVIEEGSMRADPLSALQALTLGYRLYYARQFEESLALSQSCGDLWLQQLCLQALGREEEALAVGLNSADMYDSSEARKVYQRAFAESGSRGFWRKWTERSVARNDKPYDIAGGFAWAGDKDRAFEWLERAYELPVALPFVSDSRFDSLKDDARYVGLLRRLGLPEEAIAIHMERRD